MTTESGRVYLVDDDALVRRATVRVVASAGYDVVAFASAGDFLKSGYGADPGCLVLDMRLPDMDGMEVYRTMQEMGTMLPVIFMTGFGDIPMSVEAMKAGAVDFLPKPVGEATLLRAIGAALEEDARGREKRQQVEELSRRYARLTARERQVLSLIVAGRLNKQVASELGISEKTVKVHRGRVMAKMGARRVAQLVQFAVLLGLETASPQQRLPGQTGQFRHVLPA